MKYSNIDQWKNRIKELAVNNHVSVQEMQQRYILEEFARKISASKHKDSIVIKGGFVVSALLGIDARKTRDIDFTFNSTIYSIAQIKDIITDIIHTPTDCFFTYEILDIKEQQLEDHYHGYSCTIVAINEKSKLHLKLDISNNTLIYPHGIETPLHSFIEQDDIYVMTYSIKNIIAEKYETTLDRGIFNTRIRDLFDVYYLFTKNHYLIDNKLLAKTIINVSKSRNTYNNLFHFQELISELEDSKIFNDTFKRYRTNNSVYEEIDLNEIFTVFKVIDHYVQEELKIYRSTF